MSYFSEIMAEAYAGTRESADGSQARAQFVMASAIALLAQEVRNLGIADAATPMGAIELLAKEVKDGLGAIAEAIDRVEITGGLALTGQLDVSASGDINTPPINIVRVID